MVIYASLNIIMLVLMKRGGHLDLDIWCYILMQVICYWRLKKSNYTVKNMIVMFVVFVGWFTKCRSVHSEHPLQNNKEV